MFRREIADYRWRPIGRSVGADIPEQTPRVPSGFLHGAELCGSKPDPPGGSPAAHRVPVLPPSTDDACRFELHLRPLRRFSQLRPDVYGHSPINPKFQSRVPNPKFQIPRPSRRDAETQRRGVSAGAEAHAHFSGGPPHQPDLCVFAPLRLVDSASPKQDSERYNCASSGARSRCRGQSRTRTTRRSGGDSVEALLVSCFRRSCGRG
jgi:hypothetical protein